MPYLLSKPPMRWITVLRFEMKKSYISKPPMRWITLQCLQDFLALFSKPPIRWITKLKYQISIAGISKPPMRWITMLKYQTNAVFNALYWYYIKNTLFLQDKQECRKYKPCYILQKFRLKIRYTFSIT